MIWQFENWKVLSLLGFCYDYNISIEKFYFRGFDAFFFFSGIKERETKSGRCARFV